MSPTAIEWTDETWNPIRGCSRKSEGCRHCYAERIAARFSKPGQPYHGLAVMRSNGTPQWTGEVRPVPEHMEDPFKWRTPRRVFVNSMSDLFHENLPDDAIDETFAVMALNRRHTYQVLTKRADRMRRYITTPGRHAAWSKHIARIAERRGIPIGGVDEGWWPNHSGHIWLGVSCEDQDAFDERWHDLAETPAALRFMSLEPLIGGINILAATQSQLLHWVIAGCESGPGARPCSKRWLQWLRDQCRDSDVPFFLKQAIDEGDEKFGVDCEGRVQGITCGMGSKRKPGGVIGAPYLDGRQHLEFPA